VDELSSEQFPRVVWVASRPPIPPFSGPTSKSLCGIDALARVSQVHVVTFAAESDRTRTASLFESFWGNRRSISCQILSYGPRTGALRSVLDRRFQFGSAIARSSLPTVLTELDWSNPACMLVFDDIVLAPFAPTYGRNAIVSPHDCMSEMFRSHYRLSPSSRDRVKYFLQYRIAKVYEQQFYHRALLVHVIADRDRIWLQQINPRARYHVVQNADLLNPGFTRTESDDWDVMIWGDLRIGSIARGAKEFLAAAAAIDTPWLLNTKVLVVGRVPEVQAQKILGPTLSALVRYSVHLEDTNGKLQQARITVVPDIGGAGIKNRCVNILASGRCLACLYEQMEGIEQVWDVGAINATDNSELVKKVRSVLDEGTYQRIGDAGKAIYEQHYSTSYIQDQWAMMVKRALAVRRGLAATI
jgi:hypothetical protein